MRKEVTFIIPYFGKFPNYFQIFLDSCRENSEFDWLIFSDDTRTFKYPENVHLVYMTFSQCRDLIQSYFDFPISLTKPQKLCDYKCAYGYIFKDYLTGCDWWGHCDLDQVFGDLGAFVTEEMLNTYDKIGSLGHLTLYRNTHENNCIFMSTDRYREVFSTERGCAFDEWLPGNINEVYLDTSIPVDLENYGADINAYRKKFELVNYDVKARRYVLDTVHNNIFHWDHGVLIRIWKQDRQLCRRQYPYIHLQKRKMKDKRKNQNSGEFYIIPNVFTDVFCDPEKMLRYSKLLGMINTQWFRVKWNSLKLRLKTGDWQFQSVFREK